MKALYNNNITKKHDLFQKDIIKGQKIVAAMYMVTNHLSDTDPLKSALRRAVIACVTMHTDSVKEQVRHIEILLGSAVLSGLITEKNSSILVYEIQKFSDVHYGGAQRTELEELFGTDAGHAAPGQSSIKDIKRTSSLPTSSHRGPVISVTSYNKNIGNKGARQDRILSFINDRKSAVIKDIISLFPDVSEKTIQRELGTLVESGRITKRGSKRWSVYMAVNSLL